MSDDRMTIEKQVAIRIIRLEAIVQGLVVGLIAGLAIFVATNWLRLKGGSVVGPHLALLGQFFIGYDVTFVGSVIGFGYGFGCGFVAGYTASVIYNRVAMYRGAR